MENQQKLNDQTAGPLIEEWIYCDKNYDFLLRFKTKKEENGQLIRIEILNTKIISKSNEMFFLEDKTVNLLQNLEYSQNYDSFTLLSMLFNTNTPYIKEKNKDELILKIKKSPESQPITLILKKEECKDKIFLNKNNLKKIKQIKIKIEERFKELVEENKELMKENINLKSEIEDITELNKKLAHENEDISKKLKELGEIQNQAIENLSKGIELK